MKRPRSVCITPAILKSLSQLQDGLNAMINTSWRTVRSLDDWSLAITMESTELLDSYPWKWWKNIAAEPDFNNVKIELVDILHFSLSGMIQLDSSPKCADVLKRPLFDPITPVSGNSSAVVNGMLFLPLTETTNAVASFRNIIQLSNFHRFDLITESMIAAAADLDFNLTAYYVAKHTLNWIRQLGGYKNGTYVKVNNGVEDNVLLHRCIDNISVEDTLDAAKFEAVWNGIMTSVYEAFGVKQSDRRAVSHWMELAEK